MFNEPLQLDLFADHVALLNRGRGALAEFDLDAALESFDAVLAMLPSHADARAARERTQTMLALLAERLSANPSVATALLEIVDAIEIALRPGLYRRVARETARARVSRTDDLVEGEPAGFYWLLGGDLVAAEESLRATIAVRPADARARAYLGDVLHERGQHEAARAEYLHAFLDDPKSIATDRIRDTEVLSLLAAAEDFDVPGDAIDWVPAVGVALGVLRADPKLPGCDFEGQPVQNDGRPGRQFFRCMLRERQSASLDERVKWRRSMKELCPLLLAEYLARRR